MEENTPLLSIYESFISEEEYRSSTLLSYSKIKDVFDNPSILVTDKKQKDTEWFIFGTLVDLLLTYKKNLEEKVIINDTIPSEQFLNISNYLLKLGITENLENLTDQEIEFIYTNSGSQVNWKVDTKRTKLLEECSSYVKLISKNENKLIVSTATYNEAEKLATVIKTHPWTSHLFGVVPKNIEVLFQFKIKYTFESLNFKSMIDLIVIDHDTKTIYPFDIKTGTDLPRYFSKNALYQYKYGYQGALYKEGLRNFIKKIPFFKDYDIANFKFIYISRLVPIYPIIVTMSDFCHKEFLEWGIHDNYYCLPSLLEICEATDIYLQQINEGRTVIEPYDLQQNKGEVVIKSYARNLVF